MSGAVGGGPDGPPAAAEPGGDRSTVPLFPLGTVLYPGLPLPLLVFEDRYRAMMRDLLQRPHNQRRFGVVAIREGFEDAGAGASARPATYDVGCEAQVLGARQDADGRYEVETVGVRRFTVHRVRHVDLEGLVNPEDGPRAEREYTTAEVTYLDEPAGPDCAALASHALTAFEAYRQVVSRHRGAAVMTGDLTEEPVALSYALAATVPLVLAERQALLALPHAADRLRRLADLLTGELAAVRAVPSLPATDVVRSAWSPN